MGCRNYNTSATDVGLEGARYPADVPPVSCPVAPGVLPSRSAVGNG